MDNINPASTPPATQAAPLQQIANAAPNGFDLAEVQDTFEGEVELFNPKNGAGLGAFITLAGPEHPKRKAKSLNIRRAQRAAWQAKAGKGRDVEEDDQDSVEFAVTATLGWRGIRFNGVDYPYTPENARQLYTDPKSQWVLRQVGAALNDLTLFTKA